MATNKKSALLYCDLITTVEKLSDVNAGLLFKHFLRYINDLNPDTPNEIIDVVFEPIKQQLKRDLKKWETKSVKNSEIAKERWDKVRTHANASNGTKNDTKSTDTVTDTDTVKDNVKVIDIKEYRAFKHLKLSFLDFDKLLGLGYTKEQVDGILDSIENYKKNTNYTSLYLTAVKWLKKEYPNKGTGKMETFLNNIKTAENL
jgi:hypothetical protein